MAAPKRIELTLDEQRQLKERLKESNLSTDDQQILLGLIDFNQWLQLSLQEKKVHLPPCPMQVRAHASCPPKQSEGSLSDFKQVNLERSLALLGRTISSDIQSCMLLYNFNPILSELSTL